MLKADFHIHSNVSDGSDSINTIIELAILEGLDVIAITDHDTLSHQNKIPKDKKIKILTGIEISATDFKTMSKAHILGYNIKHSEIVEELTHPLLELRHLNSLKQIKILEQHGFKFDLDSINKADKKYIYKQHILEYLFKTGQTSDKFGEFYKTVFKNGGFCDFDIEYIDVYKAVETIKKAGGKAVLAHSGQQQNYYLIDKLVDVGLDGLEYNHPANDNEAKEKIKNYSEKYNLFLTGGSDYHGTNDAKHICIGGFISEESGVRALI